MKFSWRVASFVILAAFSTLTACAEGVLPTETPTPTPTFTPSPSPEPTSTPTPLPEIQVDEGQQALWNGDWDRAEQAFWEAMEHAIDAEERELARMGLIETMYRSGRFAEVIGQVEIFLDLHPDSNLLRKAYFARAQANSQLGQYEAAAGDYAAYLENSEGHLQSYVEEWIGDQLWAAGNPGQAIQHYQIARSSLRLANPYSLDLKIVQAYYDLNDYPSGFEVVEGMYSLVDDPLSEATLNYLAGLALEWLGRSQEAHQRYLDSIEKAPQAYDTYLGLVRLVEAGVGVDDFQRGLVDYYAGVYQPALEAFNRKIAQEPTPESYYYRGLTRRELGDSIGAMEDFQQVLNLYGGHELWGDALLERAFTEWAYLDMYSAAVASYLTFVDTLPTDERAPETLFRAGRTAERIGDLQRAVDIWLRLPVQYPQSSYAFDGVFHAGVTSFRLGDLTRAETIFQQALEAASETGQRAAALLWVGKVLHAQGDVSGALDQWGLAREADPTGYYSERAQDLMEGREPFEPTGLFTFPAQMAEERAEAERWMREQFEISNPTPLHLLDESLAADPRMLRGEEMWELGLPWQAKSEFEHLRKERAERGDGEATFRLMHYFLDKGLYQLAIYSARGILDLAGMDDAATMQAPVYFNYVRFGPYFGDLILPAALEHDFDALFLLSVVRQESLFEGFATSYASAHGLMQIIPSTGAALADQLGWPPNYQREDLYRPIVSVRLGSHYLAEQRDRFAGDLYAALVAYNAGPGNALQWKELAPEDPDLFLEIIRLDQPYRYITTIFEVYDIYRDLYGDRQNLD